MKLCAMCREPYVAPDHFTRCARCDRLVMLDAENADLKARLKAVRGPQPTGYLDKAQAWERILRITDLRRKNWRKP